MAEKIDKNVELALYIFIYVIVQMLIILPFCCGGCCLPCCCIAGCIRRGKSNNWLDKKAFQLASYLFWFIKKKKDPEGVSYFVIINKKAPVIYPYLMILVAMIIGMHTFYSFIVNSLNFSFSYAVNLDSESSGNDESTCQENPGSCLEISLVEGLEAAITVFTVSVFFFAVVTYTILKLASCVSTPQTTIGCKVIIVCLVLSLQLIGFIVPRALILYYLDLYKLLPGSDGEDFESENFLSYRSTLALYAVADSISVSCLTPWFWFKDDDAKNKRHPKRSFDTETNCLRKSNQQSEFHTEFFLWEGKNFKKQKYNEMK